LELSHSFNEFFLLGDSLIPLILFESGNSLVSLNEGVGPVIHLFLVEVKLNTFSLDLFIIYDAFECLAMVLNLFPDEEDLFLVESVLVAGDVIRG